MFSWKGMIRVRAVYQDGTEEVHEFPNMITTAGRNLLRDALIVGNLDILIRYVALGAGTRPPSPDDTKLEDERFRKQITKRLATADGEGKTIVYLAPFEATDFEINEIGWFAGADATEKKDSGILVARVLYKKQKSNLESLHIERTDTITAEG